MTEIDFFEYLKEKNILFANKAEPIKDCMEYRDFKPYFFKLKQGVTIASLITKSTDDGIYVADYAVGECYVVIVKDGLLVPGSDLIVSLVFLDIIIQEFHDLEVIRLNPVIIDRWITDKRKWVVRNTLILFFYLGLTSFMLLLVKYGVDLYLDSII